jgi:hypothetical protein
VSLLWCHCQADKLDTVLFTLLQLSASSLHSPTASHAHSHSPESKRHHYHTASLALCRAGYRRKWFSSVRERLLAVSWVSIVLSSWRTTACHHLLDAAPSFPNIATLYPETFSINHHHRRTRTLETQTISIQQQQQQQQQQCSDNSLLSSKAAALTNRKNRISQMLRLLKQLDMTRARLHAKIKSKVDSINASYKRPLSIQDKHNIKRNLALIPLAMGIQVKDTPEVIVRPSSNKSKRGKLSDAIITPSISAESKLKTENLKFHSIKRELAESMDHESSYYRWLSKSLSEESLAKGKERSDSLETNTLAAEVSQSVEMLSLLEATAGKLFLHKKINTGNNGTTFAGISTSDREQGTPQTANVLRSQVPLSEVFAHADHDMDNCALSSLIIHDDSTGEYSKSKPTVDSSAHQTTREHLLAPGNVSCGLLTELMRNVSPPPLPSVNDQSLSSLRAKHSNVLARAAQACDRYSPYEFSYN